MTGIFPFLLDNSFWGSWLWSDADIFAQAEKPMTFDAEFLDCTAEVRIQSYRIMKIIPFYLLCGIILAVAIFLIPVLVFVHRRMAYLGRIRSEMLVMAEGDLQHPISVQGRDEISSLAGELNELRQALLESQEKERQSHLDNQELIRALSHDLRTPLTTLHGYLEILKLSKGNPQRYPEYIRRCLEKTEEIRGMSDKMFEYALVFEGEKSIEKQMLSLEVLQNEVEKQADDLHMQGFTIEWMKSPKDLEEVMQTYGFSGNAFLIKRLVGNICSNIVRYGDMEKPVQISVAVVPDGKREDEEKQALLSFRNAVSKRREAAGSGVGLKSAAKIAGLHQGQLQWKEESGFFQAELALGILRLF